MQLGDVIVHKATGQYAVVIGQSIEHPGELLVRMARESKDNGTDYVQYTFLQNELESVEDHLKRELSEMELRAQMLEEAKKRQSKRAMDEILEAPSVDPKDLVN